MNDWGFKDTAGMEGWMRGNNIGKGWGGLGQWDMGKAYNAWAAGLQPVGSLNAPGPQQQQEPGVVDMMRGMFGVNSYSQSIAGAQNTLSEMEQKQLEEKAQARMHGKQTWSENVVKDILERGWTLATTNWAVRMGGQGYSFGDIAGFAYSDPYSERSDQPGVGFGRGLRSDERATHARLALRNITLSYEEERDSIWKNQQDPKNALPLDEYNRKLAEHPPHDTPHE